MDSDTQHQYVTLSKMLADYIPPLMSYSDCGISITRGDEDFIKRIPVSKAGEFVYVIIDMKKFLAARLKYGF